MFVSVIISEDTMVRGSAILDLVADPGFDTAALTDSDTTSCISPFLDETRQLFHLKATVDATSPLSMIEVSTW